jgi:hypothetical protein
MKMPQHNPFVNLYTLIEKHFHKWKTDLKEN